LLNDLAIKIMQSLLYKDHLQGFRKICLEI
jgi:hypothetical protein